MGAVPDPASSPPPWLVMFRTLLEQCSFTELLPLTVGTFSCKIPELPQYPDSWDAASQQMGVIREREDLEAVPQAGLAVAVQWHRPTCRSNFRSGTTPLRSQQVPGSVAMNLAATCAAKIPHLMAATAKRSGINETVRN